MYEEIEFSYKIPKNGIVKIDEANLIIETEINAYKQIQSSKKG